MPNTFFGTLAEVPGDFISVGTPSADCYQLGTASATSCRPAVLFTFNWHSARRQGGGYLPCIPEATVCLLACMSIGAIWSSCSPDFGTASVMERFEQIEPASLIATDGYSYAGKHFDRMAEVTALSASPTSLKKIILIPYLNKSPETKGITRLVNWVEVMSTPYKELQFIPLDFSHPVWILYSSGTTGIPKAITHGHGGVLLEHYKYLVLQNDVKKGERFFWFTTTGWMMWNL